MKRCGRARRRFWNPRRRLLPGGGLRPAPRLTGLAGVVLLLAACIAEGGASTPGCAAGGSWLEPATRRAATVETILRRAAKAPIVLLGEVHDEAAHHRWQLQMLTDLHGRNRPLVIGVEMLPRGAQPALDRWVAGGLSEADFLDDVRWAETWGHDPQLYLPVFRFARSHRIPMVALNVERSLVSRVARDGWQAVPAGQHQGIGDPAPPADANRRALTTVFAEHAGGGGKAGAPGVHLERFTQAQLTWDRALAEAIAAAAVARPGATVVGIVGRGHVEHGWGIPHQLADLGAPAPMVLLPVGESEACAPAAGLADAVFVLPPEPDRGR